MSMHNVTYGRISFFNGWIYIYIYRERERERERVFTYISPLYLFTCFWKLDLLPYFGRVNNAIMNIVVHAYFESVFSFFSDIYTEVMLLAYGCSWAKGWIKLQLLASVTAKQCMIWAMSVTYITAYRQHGILNQLREARGWTWILMDISCVHFPWATVGTPSSSTMYNFLILLYCFPQGLGQLTFPPTVHKSYISPHEFEHLSLVDFCW